MVLQEINGIPPKTKLSHIAIIWFPSHEKQPIRNGLGKPVTAKFMQLSQRIAEYLRGWFMYLLQYLLDVKSRKCFYYHFLIAKIEICISLLLKSKDRPFLVWMV